MPEHAHHHPHPPQARRAARHAPSLARAGIVTRLAIALVLVAATWLVILPLVS